MIHNVEDIAQLVSERGFLPFFVSDIADFSLEEVTPAEYWFPDGTVEGVWEWKSDVMLQSGCAYGKFYRNKACFVSMECFPHLVNYRRSLHSPTADEQTLLATLEAHGSLLSRELKKMCGYVKPRRPRFSNPLQRMSADATERLIGKPKSGKGNFEGMITRLQMTGRLVTADFEYSIDRHGRRYGWSVARYCTPEAYFGAYRLVVDTTPEQSKQWLIEFLQSHNPRLTMKEILKVVG